MTSLARKTQGTLLAAERRRRALSQYRLAMLAGVHPSSIQALEAGRAGADTIKKVVCALADVEPVEDVKEKPNDAE